MTSEPKKRWPLDLKIFGILLATWAMFLFMIAIFIDGDFVLVNPLHAIVGGMFFNFDDARLVLMIEAGIFGVIGIGIIAQRRWALVSALIYLAQIVVSHLAYAITYLPIRFELTHVRESAMQGPVLVLITLYLWIRATEFLFEAPATAARTRDASVTIVEIGGDGRSRTYDTADMSRML